MSASNLQKEGVNCCRSCIFRRHANCVLAEFQTRPTCCCVEFRVQMFNVVTQFVAQMQELNRVCARPMFASRPICIIAFYGRAVWCHELQLHSRSPCRGLQPLGLQGGTFNTGPPTDTSAACRPSPTCSETTRCAGPENARGLQFVLRLDRPLRTTMHKVDRMSESPRALHMLLLGVNARACHTARRPFSR